MLLVKIVIDSSEYSLLLLPGFLGNRLEVEIVIKSWARIALVIFLVERLSLFRVFVVSKTAAKHATNTIGQEPLQEKKNANDQNGTTNANPRDELLSRYSAALCGVILRGRCVCRSVRISWVHWVSRFLNWLLNDNDDRRCQKLLCQPNFTRTVECSLIELNVKVLLHCVFCALNLRKADSEALVTAFGRIQHVSARVLFATRCHWLAIQSQFKVFKDF